VYKAPVDKSFRDFPRMPTRRAATLKIEEGLTYDLQATWEYRSLGQEHSGGNRKSHRRSYRQGVTEAQIKVESGMREFLVCPITSGVGHKQTLTSRNERKIIKAPKISVLLVETQILCKGRAFPHGRNERVLRGLRGNLIPGWVLNWKVHHTTTTRRQVRINKKKKALIQHPKLATEYDDDRENTRP